MWSPAEASYRAVTRIRTASALVAVVVAGSLGLLPHAAAQSTDPPPRLEELWDEYPLEPTQTQPATPEPVDEPASTPPAAPATESGGTSAWLLALGAGVSACIVLGAGAFVARSRRHTATATAPPEKTDDLLARAYALATEAAECDKYLHVQRHEGISVMTGTHDHDLSGSPDDSSRSTMATYADVGERVAGVLAAAETAASQIREDARGSAEEILSIARDEAEALRADAAAYDADTRAAVDSYASDRRREVDQAVEKQIAESEAQARATRQAAEAMASQIEEDARRRGQALRDESRTVEERLKKAAQGLRRMTAEIDELLREPALDGETLTDALRPYSQQPEMPAAAAHADDR